MSNTTPRTRIRIVIDDADRPVNPGGRAIIGDNIPNMLIALAAACQADPIEEDGEEP